MIIKEYYTKEEMIESAATDGLIISKASFEDWQDKGLIGKAYKRIWPGPKHNSGSISWWSFHQHALLIGLLLVRDEFGMKKIRGLCNIPVGHWLYYGEMRGVSLEQVKLAMKTFIDDADRTIGREDVRKNVAKLVEMIESPGAVGKRQFLDEYVDARVPDGQKRGQRGHEFLDEEILRYHVRNIMDPKNRNEPIEITGKDWAVKYSIEEVVDHVMGRVLGIKHLSEFPDEIWRWARTCLQMELVELQEISDRAARDGVDLKSHPAIKQHFKEKPSIEGQIGRSCFDLLAWLGLSMREKTPIRLPWYMHPKLWKEKKVRASIVCSLVPSHLVSPNGRPFMRWETSICVYSGERLTFQYEIDKNNIHWIGRIVSNTIMDAIPNVG